MTNRSSAKRHGGHKINERRGKSTLGKRDNKAKARARREADTYVPLMNQKA